jgi:hypothetical protein
MKILPIKDTFSLYVDHLYVGLMFLAFLILSRDKVNKKSKVNLLANFSFFTSRSGLPNQ